MFLAGIEVSFVHDTCMSVLGRVGNYFERSANSLAEWPYILGGRPPLPNPHLENAGYGKCHYQNNDPCMW